MKKKLLVFSTLALLMGIVVGVNQDNVNVKASELANNSFYKESGAAVVAKSIDFDSNLAGVATIWGEMTHETQSPITGAGSMAVKSTDVGYPMNNFQIDSNSSYRGVGTYFVEFDVKAINNVYGVLVGVDVTENNGYLTEFGVLFDYDSDGNVVGARLGNVGGWLSSGNENYQNGKIEAKEDGVYHCYFEYQVTENVAFSGSHSPLIVFKNRATDAINNKVIWDNVKFGQVTQDSYYTYQENNDFEDLTQNEVPHVYTSMWGYVNGYTNANGLGDTLTWESEEPISGNRSIKFEYVNETANNTQIGGFSSEELTHLIGKNVRFEYDIKLAGLEKVVLWSAGSKWTELVITASGASSNGNITNFSSSVNEENVVHVKYTMPYIGDAINFNVFGQGVAIIDNFKMSYEDVTPYVSTAGMDKYIENKAVINYDLKGGEFVSLNCGDQVVDSSLYTIDEENQIITLPASSYNEGAVNYSLVSSKGETPFAIKAIDLRTTITSATFTSDEVISKVYDGTTSIDLSEGTMTLSGVNAEDDVALTYTAALESADVNDAVAVSFTNFELTGEDAGKYKLADDFAVAQYTVKVTPKQLTLVSYDLVKEKVYDGTTTATVSNVVVEGIINSDEVNVSAVANYDKASVDAEKIVVEFAVDNANYTIANTEVSEGVAINKKDVTVVVNNASKEVNKADPTFTSTITGLVGNETLEVTYSRETGEEAEKTYQIDATIATNEVSKNYNVTVTKGTFTITSVSINPGTSNSEPENPKEEPVKGCKGSAATSLVGLLAIAGALLLKKRK